MREESRSEVAESYRRRSHKDFHQFLGHSRGSTAEIETQLEFAHDLGYIDHDNSVVLQRKTDRVARLLAGLSSWTEEN